MKKMQVLIVMMLIVVGFSACKKGPDKLLPEKWKLTEISGPDIQATEAEKQELYARVTSTFNADGKYEIAGLKDGGDQGTWSVSEDGKSLTTKSVDGKGDVSTVEEITADKLVLIQAGNKMVFAKVK